MSIAKTKARIERLEARDSATDVLKWRQIFAMAGDDLDAVKAKHEAENGPTQPGERWLIFRGVAPLG